MDRRKKTKIPLDSIFFWRGNDYSLVEMFSRNCKNSWLPQTKRLKNGRELSFANYELRAMCLRVQQKVLLFGETQRTAKFGTRQQKEKSVRSRRLEVTKREFLFDTRKPLFLGMQRFRQRPPRKLLLYLLFYFFMLLFFFKFLFNPHRIFEFPHFI